MRQIATYVDEKTKGVASSVPNEDFEQICVLASLNLTAELFSLKSKNLKARQKLKHLLDKLTNQS